MLRAMRRNLKSLSVALWIVVAAFIGTIFLVWGRGGVRGGKDVVAKVGDQTITFMDYKRAYAKSYSFYQRIFKERLNQQMLKQLRLKERVLDNLINEKVIEVVAEKSGIKVSPQEVARQIEHMDVFKDQGKFDFQKYNRVLQANRLTPAEFEEDIRASLLKEKVLSLVKDAAGVTDAEVRDVYLYGTERVKISYLELTPTSFLKKVSVSSKEVRNYFKRHKEEYRMPEKVKVSYVFFSPSHFEERVKITNEELMKYYQENKEAFLSPAKFRLKAISVRSEGELKEVKEELKSKPFEEVAREYSRDPFAKRGGDMGFLTLEELDPAVKRVVEKLGVGKTSAPVKVGRFYKIVKLDERVEEGVKSFDEMKEEIKRRLLREKAAKEALRAAATVRRLLRGGKTLEESARQVGVRVMETPFFSKGEVIPGVSSSEKVVEAAFRLREGEHTEIVRTPEGYYILRLMSERASYVPSLDEVRQRIEVELRREKAESLMENSAEKLAILASKKGPEIALKELALKGHFKLSDYFTRGGLIKGLKAPKGLADKAFALEKGQYTWMRTGDRVLVFTLADRKGVNEKAFAKASSQIKRWLLERRKEELVSQWLNDLRNRIKVKVNQKLLEAF